MTQGFCSILIRVNENRGDGYVRTYRKTTISKQLIEYKDKDIVKIETGIRRCGKSILLDIFEDYLLNNGVKPVNILHMNMESLQHRDLLNYLAFYDYVSKHIMKGEKNYLIFDELQAVTHWEKAIESFRLDFDVDIYITGSNAYLLSTEFSTLLSGRYVEIHLLPLSFAEFLTFYHFESNVTIDDKFQKFLQFGGMPILKQFDFNMARANEVLEGIYSTVILRDVLERNKATDKRCYVNSPCSLRIISEVSLLQIILAMCFQVKLILIREKGKVASLGKQWISILTCWKVLLYSIQSADMILRGNNF